MNRLILFVKNPLVWALVLAGLALCFSFAAWLKSPNATDQKIVVADIEAVTDAQKLVWVREMKNGHTEKVISESRAFEQRLQKVLKELSGKDTVILDRKAIIASQNIHDITSEVMQALNLKPSEVSLLRQELERDFLTEFPAMRKARP